MKLTFYGATETVTGSKTLIETEGGRYLVDCGLYQGPEEITKLNNKPFGFIPSELDAVFLTHAHIDHSGLLPRLIAEGFSGPIYTTRETYELCQVLLPDSAHIQESDSKKKDQRPLYTEKDVAHTLEHMKTCPWGEPFLSKDLTFSFHPAGHILGAASVSVEGNGKRALFSGDYGRDDDLMMYAPNPPKDDFDAIVTEGTYGDRLHPESDVLEELKTYVEEIVKNRSVLVIPTFAVARSQEIMLLIARLFEKHPELQVPFHINSPMIQKVTDIYEKRAESTRLKGKEAARSYHLGHYIQWAKESKQINARSGPMIILAASGMASGGRIVHHLKAFAADPNNIILLTGFQAPETPGRLIQEGAGRVYIDNQKIDIKARIKKLDGLSAHADRDQLTAFIQRYPKKAQIFLIHGEIDALNSFKRHLEELRPEQKVHIPKSGTTFDI